MPTPIKNPNLKKALKEVNPDLGKIILMKDNGYFYLTSDDEIWADRISNFYFNDIMINSFRDLSIREWVYEIVDVLIQDRFDVTQDMEPWQIELKEDAIKAGY